MAVMTNLRQLFGRCKLTCTASTKVKLSPPNLFALSESLLKTLFFNLKPHPHLCVFEIFVFTQQIQTKQTLCGNCKHLKCKMCQIRKQFFSLNQRFSFCLPLRLFLCPFVRLSLKLKKNVPQIKG